MRQGFAIAVSVLILRRAAFPVTCRKTDRFYDGRPPMTFSRHYLTQQAALDAVDRLPLRWTGRQVLLVARTATSRMQFIHRSQTS